MKTENKYTNFQRNLLSSPKCENCTAERCDVVYDYHHDEFFSESCGLVIMEMGRWLVEIESYLGYEEDF